MKWLSLILIPASIISLPSFGMDTVSTISVGLIDHDREPYFKKTGDNTDPVGAYVDILSRVSEKTGLTFTYTFLPQARIRHYMKNQVLDLEPGIAKEWRLEPGEPETSVYTDVFYKSEEAIIYSSSHLGRSDLRPKDFAELTPCSIVGFNNIDFDETEDKDSYDDATHIVTENQMVKMIKRGRCDYAVFPIDVIKKELDSGELNRTIPVAYYNLRFRLTKKKEHLLPMFNKAIKEMKANGEIQKFIEINQR